MSSFTKSLTEGCVLDRLQTMIVQEQTKYSYQSYFPPMSREEMERQSELNASWREKICQWSYNVVDHFDLPREVVAISLSLFDRYLATRGNECSGNVALLASLTTLHISIKMHSDKNVRLSTLASLSRGQFEPEHIEQMEWQIMDALGWKLNPPTLFAFVSHLMMLFSDTIPQSVRKELFEVAIYMAELSVCDSFFVKYPASAVAMAAIINVMEDLPLKRLSLASRNAFWATLTQNIYGFQPDDIGICRARLRSMFASVPEASDAPSSRNAGVENPITYSPTSTMDTDQMMDDIDEKAAMMMGDRDQFQYSPSPPTSHRMMACPRAQNSRIGTSPIVCTQGQPSYQSHHTRA